MNEFTASLRVFLFLDFANKMLKRAKWAFTGFLCKTFKNSQNFKIIYMIVEF